MDAQENQSLIEHQTAPAGWEKMFGTFADSEGFEEAVRLGREWREAQSTEDNAEEDEAV